MQPSTTNANTNQEAWLRVEITSTRQLEALHAQLVELQDDNGASGIRQITHLSILLDQLPLGHDEEGQQNGVALFDVLSHLASSPSFTTLSLSFPLENPLRLNWRGLDSSSPGQDITSTLSLHPWSHSGHHRLLKLHASGISQVPAQVVYAWMNRSSALSLEYVSLDYSTFVNFQFPSINGPVPPSSTLQHCSLRLRPLEFANFIHFHRNVLGYQSPLLRLKTLEVWAGGPLKNQEMVTQFLHKGSPSPQYLEGLVVYRWFGKDICGDDPSTSNLARLALDHQFAPSIRTLTLGAKVADLTDVPFYRKVIRTVLKFTPTTLNCIKLPVPNLQELEYVFLDGYNIGSESLKYHAVQFIEMFRDAFQRPGHRTEWFNHHYPSLTRIRLVFKTELMDKISDDEMVAFGEAARDIGVIGEGIPSVSIILED